MPTLYEISEEMRISVKKLRQMHKKGYLRCDGSVDPIADDIRTFLNSGLHLTVKQLVALIDTPSLLLEIGPKQDKAQGYVESLGDIDPAPDDVWPEIAGAAAGDKESVQKLVQWAYEAIPAEGKVSYHYLAVRLLLAVPEDLRKYEFPRLNKAFLNMRKSPEFEGYWFTERQGKRNVTWYHQPSFDL